MNQNLNKLLLNMAVLFMIAELSYINSKSLLHLAGSGETIHQVFAIIGAIAFSIVTIRVMQESGLKWQKLVFPMFDAALVFLGFNLDFHPNMRIYLTVFMAVFAGLIMYSLGLIEYKTGATKEDKQLEEKTKQLNEKRLEVESLKSELQNIESQLYNTEANLNNISIDFDNLKTELQKAESKIEVMQPIYLKSEQSRIRKKSINNRTPEEVELLEMN